MYFASGDTIYSANPNLTGVSIFHTNSAATTGLALDAADGILYDAFGAGGLVGLDLANPGHAVGIVGLEANNVAFGNGTVYFDSGNTIYATNPDLVGLTAFHSNNAPVDGLALLPPVLGASLGAAVPEPSATGVIGLGLIGLARLHRRRRPSKRRAEADVRYSEAGLSGAGVSASGFAAGLSAGGWSATVSGRTGVLLRSRRSSE